MNEFGGGLIGVMILGLALLGIFLLILWTFLPFFVFRMKVMSRRRSGCPAR